MAVTFGPRDLIGRPFWGCPTCKKVAFGVVNISGTEYSRRCRECRTTVSIPLTPLKKKVIYLEQFAVSNMVKALNTSIEAHSRTAADPFWIELFEALESVCKLQLAVCPHSGVHRSESLMTGYFPALKRMYEHLSGGVSFEDVDWIVQTQIQTALTAWLRGETPIHDCDADRVTPGRINGWQDRFLISVDFQYPNQMVEGIRAFRDSLNEEVAKVFEFYRQQGKQSFDYWFRHERQLGGDAILQAGQMYLARLHKIMTQDGDLELYDARGAKTYQMIAQVLRKHGVEAKDVPARVKDFTESDAYRDAPANRISALLWAVIAQRAYGTVDPPNRGMSNDIDVISTLMPYCDAMFVDGECEALLRNIPKRYPLNCTTRIYSPPRKAEFLEYLRSLEAEADPALLAEVREVYGESWPTPFLSMYDEDSKSQPQGEG